MKNPYLEKVLKQRLIPQPKEVEFQDGSCEITEEISVELKTAENEEEFGKLINDLFSEYWNVFPLIKLTHSKAAEEFLEDEYQIIVSRSKITLISHCSKGLQLAMKTLRQLAEPIRNTDFLQGYVLQPCKIHDYADSEFRAARYSIGRCDELPWLERQIRLAASLKFNYLFLECNGLFPFKSHPEFCWNDCVKPPSFFRTLLDVADETGITLIPVFNIFHGASMSDYGSAYHAVLNFRKEFAPLFEPGGWNWCMSNPATWQVIADLVHELYDFFEQPDYFHIGKISSREFRFCRSCAEKSADELLSIQIAMLYQSFGEQRPRFILGKELSEEKKKIKVAFPGDILLELNDGEKIVRSVDCIQNITDPEMILAEDAGGTIFELDDPDLLSAAADIAWNGKRQPEYSMESLVQNTMNVISDMEPVNYRGF